MLAPQGLVLLRSAHHTIFTQMHGRDITYLHLLPTTWLPLWWGRHAKHHQCIEELVRPALLTP